jgi:hypothetical protein
MCTAHPICPFNPDPRVIHPWTLAGEVMEVDVSISNHSGATQTVQFSVGVSNLLAAPEAFGGAGPSFSSAAFFAAPNDIGGPPALSGSEPALDASLTSGWLGRTASTLGGQYAVGASAANSCSGALLLGQLDQIECVVPAHSSRQHRVSVVCVSPGLYELHAFDILSAVTGPPPPLVAGSSSRRASMDMPAAAALAGGGSAEELFLPRWSKVYATVQRLCILCPS